MVARAPLTGSGDAELDRRIRSFKLARQCADLGARIGTIAYVTGLGERELKRLLRKDHGCPRQGMVPASPEWYHAANLIEKVEASVFAAAFVRASGLGLEPPNALVGAYTHYRDQCVAPPRVEFDRAFYLVCHSQGLWVTRCRTLQVNRCGRCSAQFLAPIGDDTAQGCPFCRLELRYRHDKRLQASFAEPDTLGPGPAVGTPDTVAWIRRRHSDDIGDNGLHESQARRARLRAAKRRQATSEAIHAAYSAFEAQGTRPTKVKVAHIVGISRQKLSEEYAGLWAELESKKKMSP